MRVLALWACITCAIIAFARGTFDEYPKLEKLMTLAREAYLGPADRVCSGKADRGGTCAGGADADSGADAAVPTPPRSPLTGWHLEGSGSHRRVVVDLDASSTAAALLLLFPIPSSVFADIFELGREAERGGRAPPRLFGKVDLESLSGLAEPQALAWPVTEEELRLGRTSVALHARSAVVAKGSWLRGGSEVVSLPPPEVLIRVAGSPGWLVAANVPEAETRLSWPVPAGVASQLGLVDGAASASVVLASIWAASRILRA